MKMYDVYGIGNALVDTEFEVSEDFLKEQKIEKGCMSLLMRKDISHCPSYYVKNSKLKNNPVGVQQATPCIR